MNEVARDYKCNTYCPKPCDFYPPDTPNRTFCVRAVAFCDCRPFWKTPACWLVTSLSVALFITITRLIVLWIMKHCKKRATSKPVVKKGSVGTSHVAADKKCDGFTGTPEFNFPEESAAVNTD